MYSLSTASTDLLRSPVLQLSGQLCLLAGITAQVTTPTQLPPGVARQILLIVALLAAASFLHSASVLGLRIAARLLVIAALIGGLSELLGTKTGFPFGSYTYNNILGWKIIDVPLIIFLAWSMLAYPCLVVGSRLGVACAAAFQTSRSLGFLATSGPQLSIACGAFTLMSWDFFLDPQMVAIGAWSWAEGSAELPGLPGIPWTNFLGWFMVSLVIMYFMKNSLPQAQQLKILEPAHQTGPVLILGWTWIGSIIGNLWYFDRPWVALWGGAVMGIPMIPYLVGLRSRAAGPQADCPSSQPQ